jgi:hypothetical protein
MNSIAIYSEINGEIKKFLESFYSKNFNLSDNLFWENKYQSPIDMIDIISVFIDNNEKFSINVWISLDENIYICVTEQNLDKLIRYIYERYPY